MGNGFIIPFNVGWRRCQPLSRLWRDSHTTVYAVFFIGTRLAFERDLRLGNHFESFERNRWRMKHAENYTY